MKSGTGSQGEAKSEDEDKEGNKTKKASAARSGNRIGEGPNFTE